MYDVMEMKKAAYALNLWTVSISQIIENNDVNILKQEYDTIVNNINLQNMPKDEALLDVIKEIMDEITYSLKSIGDLKFVEKEYRHKVKNAVWSAVPNVGAIFATANPVAMGVTLATQVGIGYMNYRKNKSEYTLEKEKAEWNIKSNRMDHLNGLQKQLFETAWRMADEYDFPDEYRLTDSQIKDYTLALMEENSLRRFNKLEAMNTMFDAYPVFWYQMGSAANSVYRESKDSDIKELKKKEAIKCFEKYYELNKFNLLRNDILTSSWALEYLELLDLNADNNPERAIELIKIAEKYSGNANDVIELCAFAYLRIKDYENAARLFSRLVNNNYNNSLNVQILSGLYIKMMRDLNYDNSQKASIKYKELKEILEENDLKYIIPIPSKSVKLSDWKPDWNKDESLDEMLEREVETNKAEQMANEIAAKKAIPFYKERIVIVYKDSYKDIAIYFKDELLNKNRKIVDRYVENVPYPSAISIDEYKEKRVELEASGAHVIFLGDTKESKEIYKHANQGNWEYSNLGMRYVSSGNNTVILVRKIKNKEIDDLVKLALEVNKKYKIEIPSGVETVKYRSLIKELYDESIKGEDTEVKIIMGIVGSFFAPLLIAGESLGVAISGIQSVQNKTAAKELKFLQCAIAIYKYLESVNALV